ncbi:MAG: 1-deoxy-D-xylulose-5-phosphate reductoisomerase [Eubacteriales bacterium]|nr:1-deoxy-D-xylulose-5-phosphate reductoisomerase [Eubacteriales bacterium]
MKKIAILGSTGSIGTQALEVIALHPTEFTVTALSAHKNKNLFLQQVASFKPAHAALTGFTEYNDTPAGSQFYFGTKALDELLQNADFDYIIVALVGMLGLRYVLQCLQMGKRVLLANKEALVAGGKLVLQEATRASQLSKSKPDFIKDACFANGQTMPSPLQRILPIDSEHSAIFQCMNSFAQPIDRIFLTCSGGPFRTWKTEDIYKATKAQALAHPNWNMGAKISIDSATLFNKALEMIEAKWLFGVGEEKIEVLVHPQSIVHSMVGFADKGIIAQLGIPSMKLPILYAISYPERKHCGIEYPKLHELQFFEPNHEAFPALQLARECIDAGGSMCTMLNAANETAVEAFLQDKITFGQITDTVKHSLQKLKNTSVRSFEEILHADQLARHIASNYIQSIEK